MYNLPDDFSWTEYCRKYDYEEEEPEMWTCPECRHVHGVDEWEVVQMDAQDVTMCPYCFRVFHFDQGPQREITDLTFGLTLDDIYQLNEQTVAQEFCSRWSALINDAFQKKDIRNLVSQFLFSHWPWRIFDATYVSDVRRECFLMVCTNERRAFFSYLFGLSPREYQNWQIDRQGTRDSRTAQKFRCNSDYISYAIFTARGLTIVEKLVHQIFLVLGHVDE